MRSMSNARVFRYKLSRAGWIMLGLFIALATLLWGSSIFLRLSGPPAESLMGGLLVVLMVGVVLIPVPAMEIIWWARGRVVVDVEGLRWRGWGKWNEQAWGEILAVGVPEPDARRIDDERIHLITEEDYEFIHGFGLRDREQLREAVSRYGDLDGTAQLGGHTFFCRPGAIDEILERAEDHVDPDDDAANDFWAGRFRRF